MGHTFSPLVESHSRFAISHGEAVAIDIALSAVLAALIGWLSEGDCVRIVHTLARCGLPVHSPLLTRRLCLDALAEAHHHGRHLVLPTGIGQAAFIEDGEDRPAASLDAALDRLEAIGRELGATETAHAIGTRA